MSVMSKRDAAERNVKSEGNSNPNVGGLCCGECRLSTECGKQETPEDCVEFCTQWIKDNPAESKWQELNIDDLPRDILVGNYEFMFKLDFESNEVIHITTNAFERMNMMYKYEHHSPIIRYRKRQPEEALSHEELAMDYSDLKYPFTKGQSKETHTMFKFLKNIAVDAFIAGCESMEATK